MSKARAKKIKLILFDVDGVLTDGTIWLFPAPAGSEPSKASTITQRADDGGFGIASANVIEAKGFHAHDGTGITLARYAGLKTGIITKRISETVALRARDLKIDHVYQGQADKSATLDKILAIEGIKADEVAFVGDDIVDLPVMRRVGLAIAVPNCRNEVEEASHWMTDNEGGKGAARDAVEYILAAQGRLKEIIEGYIASRPAVQRGSR
jgi:3-deoxy-D-manno-octulosonate 8-phosphate phosphatase (KDO 8-P phosphatase)